MLGSAVSYDAPTTINHGMHQFVSGHDLKSLALNLGTILLFLLPFALCYGEEEKYLTYIGIVVGSLLLAVIVPPFGWMRPHPYTDMPGNEPMTFRKNN